MYNLDTYPFEVRPLSDEEGGGFLVTYQDFDECIADGETIEEAIANGREALNVVIATLEELGHPIPAPGSRKVGGELVPTVPKGLHARLAARAKAKGVSMDSLVAGILSEGIGAREAHR